MDIPQGPIQMPDIDFQNLQQPPNLDNQLLSKIDNNIKSGNWVTSHHCVTVIRQINKFQPNYIPDVINRYSSSLVDLFASGKTQIMKNLLRMLKQIFDMGKTINVEAAVHAFLPILLKKSTNEIGHIKQMSQMVLTSFSDNCGYQISFIIASNFSAQKEDQNKHGMNFQLTEISIKLLGRLIQNIGQGIMQLNPSTLQIIMASLYSSIDGKRQNLKTLSLDICMIIYNLLGSQNFLSLMNYALPPEQVQKMGQAMQTHRVYKNKRVSIKTAIQEARKTQMYGGLIDNNNQNMNMNQGFNNNIGSNCNFQSMR